METNMQKDVEFAYLLKELGVNLESGEELLLLEHTWQLIKKAYYKGVERGRSSISSISENVN